MSESQPPEARGDYAPDDADAADNRRLCPPTGRQTAALPQELVDADAETAVAEPRTTFGEAYLGRQITCVTDFAMAYDCHADLLPFDYLSHDLLDVYTTLGAYLDGLRETRSGFVVGDIVSFADCGVPQHYSQVLPRKMLYYRGCYPLDVAHSPIRYANPDYRHHHASPSVSSEEKRVAWLRRYADLGLPMSHATGHFGYTGPSSVRALASRTGLPYTTLRERGRERLGRTMAIMQAWGASLADIGRAFGQPRSTVRDWIHTGCVAGFEPPADPSGMAGSTFHP